MWHVWEAAETHTGFWWGDQREKDQRETDQRERDHMEDLGVVAMTIFKLIFKK